MEANSSKETNEEPTGWSDEHSIQQAFEKLFGSNASGSWEGYEMPEDQREGEEEGEGEEQISDAAGVLLEQEIDV